MADRIRRMSTGLAKGATIPLTASRVRAVLSWSGHRRVHDHALYELLMGEYPDWLTLARQRGLLPPS